MERVFHVLYRAVRKGLTDTMACEQIFEAAACCAGLWREEYSRQCKGPESNLRMYEKQKHQSGWKSEQENSRKWGQRDSGETHHGGLVGLVRTLLFHMR